MSEKETMETKEVSEVESTEEVTTDSEPVKKKKSCKPKIYALSILIVLVILAGVIYLLEKEGRSTTTIFSTLIEYQEDNAVVAVVNGEEILGSELKTSIEQFAQAAAAQGVDISTDDAQSDIRSQALEVLINTELLKQAALDGGIEVSQEEVQGRIDAITDQLGGEENLAERMEVIGITTDKLEEDVMTEIIIQQYLDQVFEEANIEVLDEEIEAVYETAGGAEAGLPAYEEIEPQLRAQLVASKEQEAVNELLEDIRNDAEVEIIE